MTLQSVMLLLSSPRHQIMPHPLEPATLSLFRRDYTPTDRLFQLDDP